MQTIKYLFITSFVFSLIILQSCINTKSNEINVIYFAGLPMGEVMKEMIPEFTEKTGIKVNFLETPYDAVRMKEITSIKQNQGSYDVMYVDDIWMYEYAKRGLIIPLDKYINENSEEVDYSDFVEKVAVAESILNDTTWLMPQRADAQCLFYRTDLFNDETYKIEFNKKYGYELQHPKTWQEYKDIAEFFTRDTDGDGKIDLYGTTLTLKRPHFAFEFFAMRYWSFSGKDFLNEKQEPIFNSPDGIKALEFLISLKKYAPPGVSNWQHDATVQAFASGLTAMAPQWYAFYPTFNNPKRSKIVGKFSVALVPGFIHNNSILRTPSIGGGSFGIPIDSKNKDEAWKFIQFMTSKEFMLRAAKKGAIITRKSAYTNEEVLKAHPTYDLHLKSLEISKFRPRVVKYAELQEIIGLAVSQAFVGELSVTEALFNADKNVRELLKK